MEIFEKDFSNLQEALVSIGYSKKEAEKQINDIGHLVQMAIVANLSEKKKKNEEITPENFENFVKNNFSEKEIKTVIAISMKQVVGDYIQEIVKTLNPEEKDEFYKKIKEFAES